MALTNIRTAASNHETVEFDGYYPLGFQSAASFKLADKLISRAQATNSAISTARLPGPTPQSGAFASVARPPFHMNRRWLNESSSP